jgi:hypothetical protein
MSSKSQQKAENTVSDSSAAQKNIFNSERLSSTVVKGSFFNKKKKTI